MNRMTSSVVRRSPVFTFFFVSIIFGATAFAQTNGEPVEITGEGSIVVFDDFQNNRSEKHYYIIDSKNKKDKRLYFNGNNEAPAAFKTGKKYKVRGRGKPDGIEVDSLEELDGSGDGSDDMSPTEAALAPPESRKVLTLLVDFNDAVVDTGTGNAVTVQLAKDRMYNQTKSVAGLFFNSSLGTLTLVPDGDGDGQQDVFHVAINDSYIGGDAAQCSPSTWVNLASAAFEAATGKDVGIYRHRLLITPNYWDYSNRHCSWGGVAQVGCGSWCWAIGADAQSIMHGVIVHELGHNLGFNHARTDLNNNGYDSSEGTDSGYGDNSDMMGSSRNWKKFNPPHAEDKGWIDPVEYEIRSVTPGSSAQAFDLLPLDEEAWDWPGLRALKLERNANTDYYVAYRRKTGEYNNLNNEYDNRVLVYYGFDNSTYSYHAATLAAGQSFTDPTQDFVLTVTGPVTVNGEAGSTTAMGVEICRQACSSTPAPSGLTAEAQSTSTIQLDWIDNSDDEDGFDIQRSPDGSDWSAVTTVAPETTAYLDGSLQVGTTYYYRVRASAPSEDSGWSNTIGEQTFAVAPEAAFSYLEDYLDVDFTDLSNDDGTITAWSWNFGDGADSNAQNPSHQYGSGGTRTVSLTVTDNHGESDSVSHDVTVFEPPPPPFTYHSATGEVQVAGVVSGSYTETETNNGSVQSIRERESGGKKQNRYSYLEQRWTFNLPSGGTAATVSVNAWQSVSTDGDSFDFAWSSNGNDWTTMFNMSDTSDGAPRTFELPAGTEGLVYLRVRDSDRSTGNKGLDTVYVDFLQIEVSNEPPIPLDGSAPVMQPLSLNPSDTVELTWADNTSNETGFRVERSTAAGGPFVERGTTGDNIVSFIETGLEASTTYYYRVAAYKGAESMVSDFKSITTPPPSSEVSLSLSGSKSKGKHVVDLTWSGLVSDDVNIYRDGVFLTSMANGGEYTDNTGNKGAATYTYEVCEADGDLACSGEESVVF